MVGRGGKYNQINFTMTWRGSGFFLWRSSLPDGKWRTPVCGLEPCSKEDDEDDDDKGKQITLKAIWLGNWATVGL